MIIAVVLGRVLTLTLHPPAHGETGITARLEPATIDGLVYASSMVVLAGLTCSSAAIAARPYRAGAPGAA